MSHVCSDCAPSSVSLLCPLSRRFPACERVQALWWTMPWITGTFLDRNCQSRRSTLRPAQPGLDSGQDSSMPTDSRGGLVPDVEIATRLSRVLSLISPKLGNRAGLVSLLGRTLG